MREAVAVGVLAGSLLGCGRVGFGGDTRGDAGSDDALTSASRCGDPALPPASVRVTGTTFTFTNFVGGIFRQPSVLVTVVDRDTSSVVAATTSDATTGDYSVEVPVAGRALNAALVYSRVNLFTTTVFLDRPLARDLTGDVSVWNPGNGSMWGASEMGAVYGNANPAFVRSSTRGTITFEVRDCSGAPIPDVVLTLSPAPEGLLYQTGTAALDTSRTATEGTYGSAVAFNSPTGPVHIDASAPGYTFDPIDIVVSPDQAMDMVVVRGY